MIIVKDCFLCVWLLTCWILYNPARSGVWTTGIWVMDCMKTFTYLWSQCISAYDRQEVCLVHFCWNFVLSVQFSSSFFLSLSNISKVPWVHAAVFVPRAAQIATSKVSPSKIWHPGLLQGELVLCRCSQAGKKTTGAWIIIQPNTVAVLAANSWLALSLPLFYCGAHEKYFKCALELGLRCYQMFACRVECRARI